MLEYGTAGGLQKIKDIRSLFDANFRVTANSLGRIIDIYWRVPHTLDVLDWTGRIIILRKTNEWPQSWEDPHATVVSDELTHVAENKHIRQENLVPGKIYYYTLYMERTDGFWIEDRINNRSSAYPYDSWGNGSYIFKSLPKGWQIDDSLANDDLRNFLAIFGKHLDAMKTDAEYLLTLMSAEEIHADFLPLLDRKINWPTWGHAGAIQKRRETLRAVDNYKMFGTSSGYESILQEASQWDVEIYEGWRYTMFTNGRYGCTTPDLSDPNIIPNLGQVTDLIRYTNNSNSWHSVSGLAFVFTDISGVSAALTTNIIERWYELIQFAKASYVSIGLIIAPLLSEEIISSVRDFWESNSDVFAYPQELLPVLEEDSKYTSANTRMIMSNVLLDITNDNSVRTAHNAIDY